MVGKSTKIYVGNLPESCRRNDLQALFERYGKVDECDIIKNYGFVHMGAEDESKAAIESLNNADFQGSTITVEASHSKVRPKPGMGGKGQCYRCGRSGHWSKECPKFGPSSGGGRMGGMRGGGDMYRGDMGPPIPPPFYRERMMSRYPPMDRMRPYPDPYDRRPMPSSMRDDYYSRRSPFGGRMTPAPSDYLYGRRSPPSARFGADGYDSGAMSMRSSRFSEDTYDSTPRSSYGGGSSSGAYETFDMTQRRW